MKGLEGLQAAEEESCTNAVPVHCTPQTDPTSLPRRTAREEALRMENSDSPIRMLRRAGETWGGTWRTLDDETTASLERSLAASKPGQNRTVPPQQWGISVCQFNHFIKMCRRDTVTWERLAQSTERGKKAGIVNGYQFCEAFVKPFTQGTGCGVSLLYNNTKPLEAQAMISHTWAEDILEVQEAIWDQAVRNIEASPEDLLIWFCILSNYQSGGEGDIGPTIEEQLEMDPFGCVIRSPRLDFMCLCVTSEQDPYDRLWCVYELNEALDVQEELQREGDLRADGFVKVEFSDKASGLYAQRIHDWAVQQAVVEGIDLESWLTKQTEGPEYAYYIKNQDCEPAAWKHLLGST